MHYNLEKQQKTKQLWWANDEAENFQETFKIDNTKIKKIAHSNIVSSKGGETSHNDWNPSKTVKYFLFLHGETWNIARIFI